MASDDFGRDLASVQALLRKHEGLERDLAALEDKAMRRLTYYPHKYRTAKKLKSGILTPYFYIFCPSIRSILSVVMLNACSRHIPKMPPRST